MKYLSCLIIIITFGFIQSQAQNWRFPDCRDLEIANIEFGLTGSDTIFIDVRNNCDSCEQHVYTGLIAYLNDETVAVEDILYSKPSPENNNNFRYTLLTEKPFEISNELRVEMVLLCDSIKYAEEFMINNFSPIVVSEERITINTYPICNEVFIEGDFANYSIIIEDEVGNLMADYTDSNSPLTISTSAFEDQLYFLSIQHQNLQNVGIRTIVKSCYN